MITKPSISFLTSDSDALLLTDTETILANMTGNPAFATPDPTLPEVTTAQNGICHGAGKRGERRNPIDGNQKRQARGFVAFLREPASYVQVACNGDLTVLLSSGFPIQKPQRFPIGVLPAPTNVAVTLGTRERGIGCRHAAGLWRVHLQLASGARGCANSLCANGTNDRRQHELRGSYSRSSLYRASQRRRSGRSKRLEQSCLKNGGVTNS